MTFWVFFGLAVLIFFSPIKIVSLKSKIIRYWSNILLFLVGLQVDRTKIESELPPSPFVVVANHISWLDIFVLLSIFPVSFIAKVEIRKWFVLGKLVALAGTIFIDRNNKKSLKDVAEKMSKGSIGERSSYAFFPEGKTSKPHKSL